MCHSGHRHTCTSRPRPCPPLHAPSKATNAKTTNVTSVLNPLRLRSLGVAAFACGGHSFVRLPLEASASPGSPAIPWDIPDQLVVDKKRHTRARTHTHANLQDYRAPSLRVVTQSCCVPTDANRQRAAERRASDICPHLGGSAPSKVCAVRSRACVRAQAPELAWNLRRSPHSPDIVGYSVVVRAHDAVRSLPPQLHACWPSLSFINTHLQSPARTFVAVSAYTRRACTREHRASTAAIISTSHTCILSATSTTAPSPICHV